jgi:hypothetical protein
MIVWVGMLAMSFMGSARRLDQGQEAPQPRDLLEAEELHHDADELRARLVARRSRPASPRRSRITRAGDLGIELPTAVWVIWAGLIIWATTNAVNVTDGLDGLAGGSALMGFGAFMIIAYWAFRNPEIYGSVVNPLDMGVLAPASPAPASGSCGGTRRRRGSSWVTSARWASAPRWRSSRSRSTPTCC